MHVGLSGSLVCSNAQGTLLEDAAQDREDGSQGGRGVEPFKAQTAVDEGCTLLQNGASFCLGHPFGLFHLLLISLSIFPTTVLFFFFSLLVKSILLLHLLVFNQHKVVLSTTLTVRFRLADQGSASLHLHLFVLLHARPLGRWHIARNISDL